MARRKKSSERTPFSCPFCGHPYRAYPPDDHHTTVNSDEEFAKGDADGKIIPIIHDCENEECKRPITLYWYRQKRAFMTV